MAESEHIAILKQGAGPWNRWREEHPEVQPQLAGADLRGTVLVGANLAGADLQGARLGKRNSWAPTSREPICAKPKSWPRVWSE